MHRVLVGNLFVSVPISNAFTHCVGAVEELHEAHIFFQQPAR
jgi:hypothetical protein